MAARSAIPAMADAPASPTSVTGDAEPDAKDENPPPVTLSTLPPELLEAVWMKLPASAALHICATCRGFRATARSDIVWRSLLARDLLPPGFGAASAVLRAVKDADAVVCGSRGLGAAQKALLGVAGLGSVSHELVRGSRVPVTVVPSTTPVPEMITAREGADASAETKKRQR